jgi:PIN domain nuclease of toxin-antitoxin system
VSRYLLDTHALILWALAPSHLDQEARIAIADGRADVVVSAASAWEIAIKRRTGKLDAPSDLRSLLVANRFQSLPITFEHAEATQLLPFHHKVPFDRLLIAQAQVERLVLITRDAEIRRYDVQTLAA